MSFYFFCIVFPLGFTRIDLPMTAVTGSKKYYMNLLNNIHEDSTVGISFAN